MNRATQAVVFDFDGTIADSFLTAITIAYDQVHHAPLPDEDISRLRSMSLLQATRALSIPLWHLPFLFQQVRHLLRSHITDIKPVPGIDESIQSLHEGYKLFVLSANSTTNLHVFLYAYGIEHYFSKIYGDAGALRKERQLAKLLHENTIIASDAWYVSDEARDIKAAHRVGMKAAAVTWGYSNIHVLKKAEPDCLAFTPDELVRCIANNNNFVDA